MTWLVLVFALEMGWQQQSEILYANPYPSLSMASYEINSPYTKLEAGVELFRFLEIGGDALIYVAATDNYTFAPYDARFTFHTRLRYKALSVGWEHLCIHPILTDSRPDAGYFMGGGDRIFLRLEAKVKP